MSGADSSTQQPGEETRVSNRERRPSVRRTARAAFPMTMQSGEHVIRTAIDTSDPSAGGGRGFWYEWELRDTHLQDEIDDISGGGGGGGGVSFVHKQTVPAATWVINHALGIVPDVILTDDSGNLMYAEIRHPSDQQTLIVHSAPYTGTAYLRS